MYREGTHLELKHWNDPDHMHRTMLFMGIALTWHSEGDPDDPTTYKESFDVLDSHDPASNRTGLTRAQVDEHTFGIYWDEQCK